MLNRFSDVGDRKRARFDQLTDEHPRKACQAAAQVPLGGLPRPLLLRAYVRSMRLPWRSTGGQTAATIPRFARASSFNAFLSRRHCVARGWRSIAALSTAGAVSIRSQRELVLECAENRARRHLERPEADGLHPLLVRLRNVVREGRVDLLGHAVKDTDVVGCPATVELAQAEVDMASNGDEGAVPVDEGDDRTNEGIVDVRQVRCEVLRVRSNQLAGSVCVSDGRRTGTCAFKSRKRMSRSIETILSSSSSPELSLASTTACS